MLMLTSESLQTGVTIIECLKSSILLEALSRGRGLIYNGCKASKAEQNNKP